MRVIEIGVAPGDNSLSALKELAVDKLFLVDPYVPYEFDGRIWDTSADCAIAHAKLSEYPQAVWLRKPSEYTVDDLHNESFDFIYVDGNHSYEFVKKDIALSQSYKTLSRQNFYT